MSNCQISSSLFIFQNCYFINSIKISVIENEHNLNMVDSSFKIVNTFTMLAGEGRMMTEGKGEWTEPEEINEKVKLGWWTSHLLVFGIHSKKKKKKIHAMDVISLYAEYTLNFLKWEFNQASLIIPYL